jgi:lysophospholipase L1-like esterase
LWSDNHCALAENTDGSAARYTRIDTLNAWIKQYGFEQGLIVIDYHAALVAADGEHYKPELTFDGVHPSEAGYALMSPMVEDAITADELK